MNWSELIGKKIVALRGITGEKTKHEKIATTPLSFILFDDGKTFIELYEQDYYSYHDCNCYARLLDLKEDCKKWQTMFDKKKGYDEPTNLEFPF